MLDCEANDRWTKEKAQDRKMCKVYSTLLKGLAHEYNNVLLRPIKKTRLLNESKEGFSRRKKKEREEEEDIDDSLSAIEDEMLTALSLKRRKVFSNVNGKKGRKTRGPYEKFQQYFTDPDTGIRSKMTPEHTVWYQCYILHPNIE